MRVVFALPGYKPAWNIGGPVVSGSSLAEGLVRRGHEVTVVASNSNLIVDLDVPTDKPVSVDGVTVYYFGHDEIFKRLAPRSSYLSKSIGFLYSKRMRPCLDELVPRADIVHTHLPFNYPTYAAAHAAFRHGKPLVYHQRGVLDPARLSFRSMKKALYLNLIEKPILRRADTLIALTEDERNSYRRLNINTRCSVIPNGVDATLYSGGYDPREMDRVGIRDGQVVILFMGRLHPIKGVDLLIESFLALRARFSDAVLVIAGPDEFGLEAKFKERVRQANVPNGVIFVGTVRGEAKRQLLLRADVFCLPSVAEGFSMAVLEALAASTAVLLSPGCNFPDVITARAGRICERSVNAIERSLEAMLADRSELRAMGKRGRELIESKFTWDSVVERMVEVYERAVSGPGRTYHRT